MNQNVENAKLFFTQLKHDELLKANLNITFCYCEKNNKSECLYTTIQLNKQIKDHIRCAWQKITFVQQSYQA